MGETAKLLMISIREGDRGVVFATSDDESDLFVVAVGLGDVVPAVSAAIEDFCSAGRQTRVKAIPLDRGAHDKLPWAVVPLAMLANLADTRNTN